jgi:alkanesulfonate monooxygenase SsuD/methylene tetrahydromethanopterin reductase-like flavin-dependent oxidoreductase (luciferase family)
MDIIYTPVWQDFGGKREPVQFVQDELLLMEQVEGMGFDAVFSPEHHFDIDYSACPDNFLPLAYIAGKTTKLKVGLGAVILPWNEPLRVVEKLAFLDHISNGRCWVGFGRGLARMEYNHFGISMDESRGRFDESVEMVLKALRTGVIEGDGQYYKQPKAPIAPRPRPSLADSFWSVGMSPDSAAVAGKIGARLLSFVTKPMKDMLSVLNPYYDAFKAAGHKGSPHVMFSDFFMVRENPDEARELGLKYVSNYFSSVMRHYELAGTHFDNTKGYGSYSEGAKALRDAPFEAAATAYMDVQLGVGSPNQILERLEERFRLLGPEVSVGACCFYGGMGRDVAQKSLDTFSKKVMPAARDLARSYARAA